LLLLPKSRCKKSKREYGRSSWVRQPGGSRRLALALAVAALAAGCGDDDEDQADSPAAPTATQEQQTQTTAPDLTNTSTKPAIPKPTGSPPRKLLVEDIVKGKGRLSRKGDTLTVQYVGVTFSTGTEFDSSWDRGQPFTTQIPGQVIEGWNRGLLGMRQGGRRKLTIPPRLAYGPQGFPPDIGPNETLVFVIDLVGLR
jgi:peptidylprolyl isomerase